MNRIQEPFLSLIAALASLGITEIAKADGFPQASWNGTIEIETEQVEVMRGSDFRADTLAFIFGRRSGPNKVNLKLEKNKDHDEAAEAGGKLELRYRRYFPTVAGIEPNVRFGIGENIKDGGASFSYYTVEPKLAYEVSEGREPYVSVRYRQRMGSPDWHTWTLYFGMAFSLGADSEWEIEPSIFHKTSVEATNGFKVELTRAFH